MGLIIAIRLLYGGKHCQTSSSNWSNLDYLAPCNLSEARLEQYDKEEESRAWLNQRVSWSLFNIYSISFEYFFLLIPTFSSDEIFLQSKVFCRLVIKGRELDAKLKELEAQAEVSQARNPNLGSPFCFQAWPRIVATATKNNIGAPAARELLEEVFWNITHLF